jgi:hypothetical protein
VVDSLPSMSEALGSVLNSGKKEREKERKMKDARF